MPSDEPEPVTKVYNDDNHGPKHREVWTDGETIRVGRRVEGNRGERLCIAVHTVDMPGLIETLRDEANVGLATTATRDRGYEENHTYVFRCRHGQYRLYQGDHMVLRMDDHECGTLYSALSLARDLRDTFDYERLATDLADRLALAGWSRMNVEVSESGGASARYASKSPTLNLHAVNQLDDDDRVRKVTVSTPSREWPEAVNFSIGITFDQDALQAFGDADGGDDT